MESERWHLLLSAIFLFVLSFGNMLRLLFLLQRRLHDTARGTILGPWQMKEQTLAVRAYLVKRMP